MTLAYDYPLLGIFWTMLVFFIWIVWILALFHVFADIFRSHDMGGVAKTIWVLFVIFLPYLGVFVYLIARGDKMSQHALEQAQRQEAAQRAYIQSVATTTSSAPSAADELAKLADLKASGAITEAEYNSMKAKVVA